MVARIPPRQTPPVEPRASAAGRIAETWPPLHPPTGIQVGSVATWLAEVRGTGNRSLKVAAPLLATVCALYARGLPLPTRERLAAALGCSKAGIDATISTSLGDGEIVEEYQTFQGVVEGRASVTRRRYLIPCKELFEAYQHARPPRTKQHAAIGG
jgi:hypothetical protein